MFNENSFIPNNEETKESKLEKMKPVVAKIDAAFDRFDKLMEEELNNSDRAT